uniref:Tyrosyl-DNA phosphodiesterase n=1 Tax=Anopheles funestus TaxID=62324 RepID=A0A182S508_ANOFN
MEGTQENELSLGVATLVDALNEEISANGSDVNENKESCSFVAPRGQMAAKLEASAPYNFFLTTITDSAATHTDPLSVTFQELLDPSLGALECSLQICFLIDIYWLLQQYSSAGYKDTPLLILYGRETPELETISQKHPNVTASEIEIKTPCGVHHTKMGLYGYRDGSMRVVISTANLYEAEWHNRTQGLWISPRLPAVPEGSDTTYGESRTDFRASLLSYLDAYKLSLLDPWMARIRKSDFSDVKVFLVASVPCDKNRIPEGPLWGYPRMGYLLSQYATEIDHSFPLIAQCSVFGNFGGTPKSWIQREIMVHFGMDNTRRSVRMLPGFRFIFPTYAYVCESHNGLEGGYCLPYPRERHERQKWLDNYLYQWISETRNRNKAVPHIKTYCRWSPKGLQWFLLTSANLSKSAWGTNRFGECLFINNYEVGVLFLPKILLNEDFLPMDSNGKHTQFPMPYDIPIVPYGPKDTPFFIDYLHPEETE